MPNGHGGVPYMAGPVLFLILCVVAALLKQRFGWAAVAASVAFAGLAGWRLGYYLHFWDADEYDGAYTRPDEYRRARRRYFAFGALYALVAMAVVSVVIWAT